MKKYYIGGVRTELKIIFDENHIPGYQIVGNIMQKATKVMPRKGWSPGHLTSKEVGKFIKGELSFEDLEKLENTRKEKGMKKKDGIKVTQVRNFDKTTTFGGNN